MPSQRSLYFAYGSNMDTEQMRERCGDAHLHGSAVLEGYRFLINSRGVASIAVDEGARVHGVAWSLTDIDLRALDRYEGVRHDRYVRTTVDVVAGKDKTPAWVYIASDNTQGRPLSGYLEGIVAAARAAGLPDQYIRELEGAT